MNFYPKWSALIFFSVVSGTWNTTGYAYIPPSQFIVKSWVKKHAAIKNLRIRATVSALEDGKPSGVRFKETALFNFETLTVKSWATDESEHKLYLTEKSLKNLSAVSKLLLSSNSQEVMDAMKEKMIPVRTTEELLLLRTESERAKTENESLARWNRSVAWVIGTPEPKEASIPQVWFEKDTFLPLRLVYTQASGEGVLDFRFENFHFFREFPYPRSYSVLKKGAGAVLQVQLIDLNAVADGTKLSGSAGREYGFTAVGESAPNALKDLIRFYYESVR